MKWLYLITIGFSVLLLSGSYVRADEVEDEEEEGQVEDDTPEGKQDTQAAETDKDLDEEDVVKALEPSPDAEVTMLFTHPVDSKEFPATSAVKLLVNFLNKGDKDFLVDSLDVSFRYPMDYSFTIQNYTGAKYGRLVEPKQEATFDYAFFPGESYAGRPFTLSVLLKYHTADEMFMNAVHNDTVNVVEDESPFNPETGFLYVVFGCIVVLLLLVGQQFLLKMRKKHGMTKRSYVPPVEMGTSNKSEVDFEWIPREVLNHNNKSPGGSPGRANKRKARRAGADD